MDILLFSIPEAIVISWLAYVLSGDRVSFTKVVTIGSLLGIASALIRPVMGSYLVNVPIYAALLVLLLSVFRVSKFWERVASVAIAMPIYIIVEYFNMVAVSTVLSLDLSDPTLFKDTWFRFLCFLPQISLVSILALVLMKFGVSIFPQEDV